MLPAGYRGVTLETNGATGDTRLYLYDSSLNQIDFDDDSGNGLFSRIERSCSLDPLPGGTYYAKVDAFGNNNAIDAYTITLTTTACPGLLFFDGFESGSTSAWSVVVP